VTRQTISTLNSINSKFVNLLKIPVFLCWNHMNKSSDICAAWNRLDSLKIINMTGSWSLIYTHIPLSKM
jgi:hypothetical protein